MPTFSEDEYNAMQTNVAPSDDDVKHFGTPRHSGRYPWGSGDDEGGGTQRNSTLLAEAERMRRDHGMKDTEIANGLGITTTQLRDMRTVARNERKQDEIHMARKLKATGMSNGEIAKEMQKVGFKVSGESQVRNLLKDSQEQKTKVLDQAVDTLRRAVEQNKYLDVGAGVEYQLSAALDQAITPTRMRAALQVLKNEGYKVHSDIKVEQLGTGKKTNMRVLAKPGTTWGEVQKNHTEIKQLDEYKDDGGYTSLGIKSPLSISSKRVGIRYAEQGGTDADGVMYVRRGVPDVSLGRKNYAQVRVLVDKTHYIKGMALYRDDMPEGVDILFNTNKSDTGNKLDALKPVKRVKDTGEVDPDNPFGASIKKQIGERDPHDGKIKKLTSVMNLVNEEGDWDDWTKSLSSQLLSKQTPNLARDQLDLTYTKKKNELDTILALNNPSVKKKLLEAYADGTDSSAIHLKAAAMPKQKTQVILPVKEMKDTEVYAPNFKNGDRVALVRFPHGGTFEIPELTVNNRNPSAKKQLGPDALDAIGIHPRVAERLSGADFDGDTVLVIPNNDKRIKSSPPLERLRGFDAKAEYPHYEGMKRMTKYETGLEMGKISNLITDMTIGRANSEELARAVRHSMVVIDAEKHGLDYRRSEVDHGITALKRKYQPDKGSSGGASTLISRATSRLDVGERKLRPAKDGGPIDPATGKLVYVYTDKSKTWTNAKGKEVTRRNVTESVKLAETDDAHTLSSGTVIEKVYADHSNRLKALANEARKELVHIKPRPYNASAKKAYASEVSTLNAKLTLALKNAPRERQAQVFANAIVKLKVQANPELKLRDNSDELKRVKRQALAAARLRTDAKKAEITITDGEWKAIQAGAITHSKLDAILTRANLDEVKQLATPRVLPKMSSSDAAKARTLKANGLTWAEVSEALGLSITTIKQELGGGDED